MLSIIETYPRYWADPLGDGRGWGVYTEDYLRPDDEEHIDGSTRRVSDHDTEADAVAEILRLQGAALTAQLESAEADPAWATPIHTSENKRVTLVTKGLADLYDGRRFALQVRANDRDRWHTITVLASAATAATWALLPLDDTDREFLD